MEIISHEEEILAIIIRANQGKEDVNFPTPFHFSMQMGAIRRAKGYKVPIHHHEKSNKDGLPIQEILFIKTGLVCLTIKNKTGKFTREIILKSQDVIMLLSYWHGLEVLENCEMIDIKPGTYPDKKIFYNLDEQSNYHSSNL